MLSINQKSCRICGTKLNQIQSLVNPICSAISCRTRYLTSQRDKLQQHQQTQRHLLAQSIKKHHQTELVNTGISKIDAPCFTLPAVDSQMIQQSLKNKQKFLKFLLKNIREAISKDYCFAKDKREHHFASSKLRVTPKPKELALAHSLCTLCGGSCCQKGENFAYITPTMLRRKLELHSNTSASDLFHIYKRALPKETFNSSCVYHGKNGCALPRELRSDVCNRFYCKESADIIYAQRSECSPKVFVVAKNDKYIVRTAMLSNKK